MDKSLRLSVHQLVDFLLRSGDIDNRVFNRSSMNEGSRLHSEYQGKQSSNYMSEYPLAVSLTALLLITFFISAFFINIRIIQ